MGYSMSCLTPNAVENQDYPNLDHLHSHPNIPHILQVLHTMWDARQRKACSADEFDPIERVAIQQIAYRSTKHFGRTIDKKYLFKKKIAFNGNEFIC